MSAQLLSFTTTMTETDVQRAMCAAMIAVATERNTISGTEADRVLVRQLATMACAFVDLAAQLGISPPTSVANAAQYA